MLKSLRVSVRQLGREWTFSGLVVLTFALGIGANTAAFSVMNAVVLRMLPVANPERLVFLHTTGQPRGANQTGFGDGSLALPVYEQLRDQRAIFSDLMAYVPLDLGRVAVRKGAEPDTAFVDMVSGDFFSGLGVRMAQGRGFSMDDEKKHTQVAVISDSYWRLRFGGDGALGQTVFVKGVPFTVIGVTARDFTGLENGRPTDLWVPVQDRPELKPWGRPPDSAQGFYSSPDWWFLMAVGRLAPGVSQTGALAAAQPVFQRAAYTGVPPLSSGEHPVQLFFSSARGIPGLRDAYERPLTILMGMVTVVLLIACANVTTLIGARNASRRREFSLRLALGSSIWHLFRQLLAESLLLVAAGAVLGWLFAIAAIRALAAWSELDVSLAPDANVLAYALGVSFVAALAFGLAPLRTAAQPPASLELRASGGSITADRGKQRMARLMMIGQVALCVVLVIAASLLVRTLRNLGTADLGMRTSGLVVFGITPPQTVHGDEVTVRFYQTLLQRLRSIPGVDSATLMANRLGSGWSNNTRAIVDGAVPQTTPTGMRWNSVGPGYFHLLGIPVLLGRDFTDADDVSAPPVAIVNDTFARRFLPGRDPLGHRVAISSRPGAPQYTIVGVAANSRYTSVRETDRPMAYFPYTQLAALGPLNFELRTNVDPLLLLPLARKTVQEFGPDLPLVEPMTQEEQFAKSFSDERLFARLAMVFGALAAALVAAGLYGTFSYRVNRRTAEIGVRMALGAERGSVLWMIVRESLALSAVGVAVGLPLAFGASRLLESMLFNVSMTDPLSFAAAILAMALIGAAASLVPAARASAIDPLVALRAD